MGDKLGDKPSEADTAVKDKSQVGDKLGDRRQALQGGHSTPAKADTLKTALRTPTVNCLGKKS